MTYSLSSHAKYHNRYHVVWITKYRYKVLSKDIRYRLRHIIRQICNQMGVNIIRGVLSNNHIHMFVEIPPRHSVSDVMRRIKGCSSRKLQQEFPELKRRYWGQRFWARGYFCTTSGLVNNDTIINYIDNHTNDEPTDKRR